MSLKFTQEEVESQLADCFPHGAVREVSIISGINENTLYRQINRHDEYKSHSFGFLQVQCALDEENEQLGEQHWQKVATFREMSKKRKASEDVTALSCFSGQCEAFGAFGGELMKALNDGALSKDEILKLQPFVQQLKNFCEMFDEVFRNAIQKPEIRQQNFGDLQQ